MSDAPNLEGEADAPKKKPAKKTAGLRARSGSALLSNPALSGAASVVARSVLGQGPSPASTSTAGVSASPVVPAPSVSTEMPAAPHPAAASSLPLLPSSYPPAPTPATPEQFETPMPEAGGEAASLAAVIEGGGSDPSHREPATAPAPPATADKPYGESPQRKRAVPRSGGRPRTTPTTDSAENLGAAHAALLNSWRDSRLDLKLRKKEWQTQPFRFAADLVETLSRRVADDCKSSGRSLTAAQYVDAAMSRHLPQSIEEQLDLAEEFLLSRDSDVGTGQQGSHRVSPAVYTIASQLANSLRQEGHARTAVHVYSGALDRFLTELEEEGPLGKANPPRK